MAVKEHPRQREVDEYMHRDLLARGFKWRPGRPGERFPYDPRLRVVRFYWRAPTGGRVT